MSGIFPWRLARAGGGTAATLPEDEPWTQVRGRDREFLPAALEVLETPPSPLRITFMLAICVFFALALVWACLGELDVHAVASGKVETAGRAKVVQPLDPGKVAAIHVQNGTPVKAGTLLIEFDAGEAVADVTAQREALNASLAEVARRRYAIARAGASIAILGRGDDRGAAETMLAPLELAAHNRDPAVAWDVEIPDRFRARERAILLAELDKLVGEMLTLDRQTGQRLATLQRLDMSIAAQDELIATLSQRVAMREQAIELQVGTKINLFDAKEQLQRSKAALASDRGQIVETEAALRQLTSEKLKTLAQFVADQEARLGEAARRADESRQNLAKAEARLARTRLAAPIDGVVQQMAVTTVGQVVTTGQQLLVLSPNDPVAVEALVDNLDIGFVRVGQEASVKVDTFPFTRFGVLKGRVLRIAPEAIDEQEARRELASTAASATMPNMPPNAAPGQAPKFVFPVTIELERPAISVNGVEAKLMPGMTVSVEIKTDRRRVIDYLLSPLARVASEAMRER